MYMQAGKAQAARRMEENHVKLGEARAQGNEGAADACTNEATRLEFLEQSFQQAHDALHARVERERAVLEASAQKERDAQQARDDGTAAGRHTVDMQPINKWQVDHSHEMSPDVLAVWMEEEFEQV
jgi:hypothetical protein